jgi:synaptobrevin family protein YKT6
MPTSVYLLGLYSALPKLPAMLSCAVDTSNYNFLTSGTVREYLIFASRMLVQRTERGARQTLDLEKYPFVVHCYVRKDGLAVVSVTRPDYPVLPIYDVMYKSIEDYEAIEGSTWKTRTIDVLTTSSTLTSDLKRYQNVEEADKITAIRSKIVGIQDVARASMEKLLQRGETIDSLVSRSNDLSETSKGYYTKSKKINSCCWRIFGM